MLMCMRGLSPVQHVKRVRQADRRKADGISVRVRRKTINFRDSEDTS